LGEGKLNWLMYSYAAITILNPVLGCILGINYNEYGVVIAWNISFTIGSLLVLFSYHKINFLHWREIISIQDFYFITIAFFNAVLGYFLMLNLLKKIVNYIHIFSFVVCIIFFVFLFIKNKKIKLLINKLLKIKTNA
jgi:hypothetical protein